MKQIFPSLLVLVCCTAFTISTKAQCDKNLVLLSSKTEYLDSAGTVQKTVDDKTQINITPTSITIFKRRFPATSDGQDLASH